MLYSLEDQEGSHKLLGRLLYEAAGQFYLDTARRRLAIHAERRSQTPEQNARVAFKVGLPLQPSCAQARCFVGKG